MAEPATTTPADGAQSLTQYDLIPKLVGKLDRHMIFPLLEFKAAQLEDEEGNIKNEAEALEITTAKYELLKKTNMTDYVANLYCDLKGLQDPPAEFADKKQQVFDRLNQFEEDTSKIRGLLEREDVVSNLRSDKVANLEFLKRDHEVRICVYDRRRWNGGKQNEGYIGRRRACPNMLRK